MHDEVFDTKSMAIASSISFFQRCSASRCCGASRCCSASRCRRIQVRLGAIAADQAAGAQSVGSELTHHGGLCDVDVLS